MKERPIGRRVNVIGVGMTKFAKPGASEDYHVMASKAGRAALDDAGVKFDQVITDLGVLERGSSCLGGHDVVVLARARLGELGHPDADHIHTTTHDHHPFSCGAVTGP